MTTTLFIALIAAYLIGSIPFAIVVSWAMRLKDPREFGSKNPGATNVLRGGNKLAAALTLLGDAGKGALVVLLAQHFSTPLQLGIEGILGCALLVFLGHLFPVFAKFKGGKGVATALGILLALVPWIGLAAFVTWILVFALTRLSSLAAILAALLAPVYTMFLPDAASYVWFVFMLSMILIQRHKKNILNLLSGQESKIGKTSSEHDPSDPTKN